MWPFRKKIKQYCQECGNVIKIPFGNVRIEQTKTTMKIKFPSNIRCSNCGKDVKLKEIKLSTEK